MAGKYTSGAQTQSRQRKNSKEDIGCKGSNQFAQGEETSISDWRRLWPDLDCTLKGTNRSTRVVDKQDRQGPP